jgi:hypothetical protein
VVSDQLAGIPHLSRFVTTNWDPILERCLHVLIPVIEDRDLAFWDDRRRQVLKIHGCITRPYSIVATQSDYDNCINQNPLIFNKLKDLMATKTFLFIGYSMRDPDFREVWGTITKALGRFAKRAYALDPLATAENIDFWKGRGIDVYNVRDVDFLRLLRERLEKEDAIPTETFVEFLRGERDSIASIHFDLEQNSDGAMASSIYQDGLLHMLDDIYSSVLLGEKQTQDFASELVYSAKTIRENRERNDPVEIAYWTGRHEVLQRFCSRDRSPIPAYFHPKQMIPIPSFVQGRAWD